MAFWDLFKKKQPSHSGCYSNRRISPQAYFEDLLTSALPECTIQTNISAIALSGSATDYDVPMPVNFLIAPPQGKLLFVIVISKDEYRLKRIKALKNYCDLEGITFMQFFYEFENASDYVISRIQNALG